MKIKYQMLENIEDIKKILFKAFHRFKHEEGAYNEDMKCYFDNLIYNLDETKFAIIMELDGNGAQPRQDVEAA